MGLAVISHSSPQEPGVSEKQLPTPSWNIVGTENVLTNSAPDHPSPLCVWICVWVWVYVCVCVYGCVVQLCFPSLPQWAGQWGCFLAHASVSFFLIYNMISKRPLNAFVKKCRVPEGQQWLPSCKAQHQEPSASLECYRPTWSVGAKSSELQQRAADLSVLRRDVFEIAPVAHIPLKQRDIRSLSRLSRW